MKYRKKPVVVEAFQWFGDNRQTEDPEWIIEAIKKGKARIEMSKDYLDRVFPVMLIDTLEGEMLANPGDFIIQGIKGEIYPCKPDIFHATYENVYDMPTLSEFGENIFVKNSKDGE